ncbi:MAG TPA: hypothetical protein VEZ46_05530 [Mycobacteriales bacterium]|nr:hypothetical protein [Mycobacteriales bacterium]
MAVLLLLFVMGQIAGRIRSNQPLDPPGDLQGVPRSESEQAKKTVDTMMTRIKRVSSGSATGAVYADTDDSPQYVLAAARGSHDLEAELRDMRVTFPGLSVTEIDGFTCGVVDEVTAACGWSDTGVSGWVFALTGDAQDAAAAAGEARRAMG